MNSKQKTKGHHFLNFIFFSILSILAANFIIITSLLISAKISWGLAAISSVLFSLALIVISFYIKKWLFSWAALIAMVASILAGMYIGDYADQLGRDIIHDIHIKAVLKHPEAGGYTLKDGFVKKEFMATYQRETNTSNRHLSSYYYAAPVVIRGWDPSKPVYLFAVASTSKARDFWGKDFRAGIRAPRSYSKEFRAAVDKCIRYYGIKTFKNPIMIKWVRSPKEAIEKYLDDMIYVLTFWNLFLVAGILIFYGISFFRHSRRNLKPTVDTTAGSKDRMSYKTIIRCFVSFYFVYILIYSVYFSRFDLSKVLSIVLLVIALIFYIIALSTLQIAHHKEGRGVLDLLLFIIYPYLAYFLIFLKLDFSDSSLWLFSGYFYYLMIVGGFIFGILISSYISRKEINRRITDRRSGKVGSGKLKMSFFIILGGLFIVLTQVFLKVLKTVQNLELYKAALFYVLLTLGIGIMVKFTFRHTSFNIKKNPELKKKYRSEKNNL